MLIKSAKTTEQIAGWAGHEAHPSTATGIASAGTTSQANSTALAAGVAYHRVDTANAAGGVRLPAPQGPQDVFVVNHAGATNAVLLYPASGGKINGLSANANLSIPVGKAALCISVNATDWVVFLSA